MFSITRMIQREEILMPRVTESVTFQHQLVIIPFHLNISVFYYANAITVTKYSYCTFLLVAHRRICITND